MLSITPIKSRIIPTLALTTMMASGVLAANPKVENQKGENTLLTEAVVADNNLSNKVNWDDIALFGVGFAAAAVALGIGKKAGERNARRKEENGETASEYFNKRFIKDSGKLYNYMTDLLMEIVNDETCKIDIDNYYKKTAFYTSKYPSRKMYVEMFGKAIMDSRLNAVQRESLGQYLIEKATNHETEEDNSINKSFAFLDNITDYDQMVNEFTNRTVSLEDSTELYDYALSLLEKAVEVNDYKLNRIEYYNKVSSFTNKYPSTRMFVDMFGQALEDSRLDNSQREELCHYLINKMTGNITEDDDDMDQSLSFLDDIDDYEQIVKELTDRTVSPEDSEQLYDYMLDLLGNVMEDTTYKIDKINYYDKVSFFTNKYPMKRRYVEMFERALEDSRLDVTQRDMLCRFLIEKVTSSTKEEEEDISRLFSFLDNIDNYEKMVEELTDRTVSSSDSPAKKEGIKTYTNKHTQGGSVTEEEDEEFVLEKVSHNYTFKDVGGQDKAIEVLKRTILFPIQYPKAFKNSSIRRGVLLYGPEGTGKTLLAEALANEIDAKFIKLNGNNLTSMWQGQTERHWRKLFKIAKENQPVIIFIDEIDSIATSRDTGDKFNNKIVNQILGLISDAEKNDYKIYIVSATNRLDLMDKALIRSGRLGKKVECVNPKTEEDVKRIYEIHINRYEYDDNMNKDLFCKELLEQHVSGADIADIIYSASENAKERCSIFEKMEKGTFQDSDMDGVIITNADMKKAIEEHKPNQKTKIGFKK